MTQDKGLSVDKSTVSTGGQVEVTGPPGGTIEVHTDGKRGEPQSAKLDASGKATIPAGNKPRKLTIYLPDQPGPFVRVEVVELFHKP